jgi:hypothetical protein
MPKTKKQAEPLSGSPTFVATFVDGVVTRMTVFTTPDNLDVERGKKLARYAYESRTKKTPPAFVKAHFEQGGVVFKAYSAVELEDEQEDEPPARNDPDATMLDDHARRGANDDETPW